MTQPLHDTSATLSLLQLSTVLKRTIDSTSGLQNVWVAAEVSDLHSSGGHTYMVLIQKDEASTIVARMRATIWRGMLAAMSARIGPELYRLLTVGNEVRVCGSLQYHPQFGLSFNITGIDPLYCRDTSRIQLRILAELRRLGIDDLNKRQELVMPPQRIAVISASGAAGYGDFMNQLSNNPHGLVFYTHIFESTMQGASVSRSIRAALERIEMCIDLFDCVVIIRGGGATSDLAGFDDLDLACAVARFPLPVAVGIGHERDNTVLDFIAHTRLKTPTAVAEWLVSLSLQALNDVRDAAAAIARYVQQNLQGETRQLGHLEEMVPLLCRHTLQHHSQHLASLAQALPLLAGRRVTVASASLTRAADMVRMSAKRRLTIENQRLDNYASTLRRDTDVVMRRHADLLRQKAELVRMLDPRDTLRRGYSITRVGGKAVRDTADVPPGTQLVTTLAEGTVTSTVN